MIRVIRDAAGLIYVDGHDAPFAGGLQASLSGTLITIADTQGGRPLVSADVTQLADASRNGFESTDAAMAYLAGALAPTPSRTVEAVAAAAILMGSPLAISRATGQLLPARADTYALAFVAGLATSAGGAGFPAQAGRGAVTISDWTAITGAPALQQGQPYFLAPAGGLTASAINPGAVCVARIGLAASAATLIVSPSDPILL